jgi:heme-degrading monooxygenase HmoA
MSSDKAKVVRVWRTAIDSRRAEEYERFARERSVPMFRSQPGFLGVFFARDGEERVVITLWQDRLSADALAQSKTYLATAEQLGSSGVLTGEQA